MKQKTNKFFKGTVTFMSVLAMLIMVIAVALGSDKALAAEKTSEKLGFDKTEYKTTCKKKDGKNYNLVTMMIVGAKKDSEDGSRLIISDVKCTNENFKLKKNEYQRKIDVYCKDKFAGESGVISCKVNGVEIKATVTFLKYQNPFREFSIGGVDMKQKFNSKCSYIKFYPYTEHDFSGKQDIRIRMKSGWRIKYIELGPEDCSTEGYTRKEVDLKKVFKTYDFKESSPSIIIVCYNKKLGYTERKFGFITNWKLISKNNGH